MIPELRPYQLDGVERLREAIRAGHKRILMVAPTGSGKTVAFASIIASACAHGTRSLVMAHRRELIAQAAAKIIASGVSVRDVGVVMADGHVHLEGRRVNMRRPAALVQVASVDTLRNRVPPAAQFVHVDEAHRSLSPTYRNVVDTHYANSTIVGWTATPFRADGRPMGEAYDELIVVATPSQLIDLGAIVEPRVFSVPDNQLPDLSNVKIKGADYDPIALAHAVDNDQLVGDIVDHWQRRAENRITVVFAASVEHSKHLTARFKAAGVSAEHLDGTTPDEERAGILARLDRGATRVVCNYGVLAEGWDQPSCKCLVLARPTKSTGLYLQQAGRILRPWHDVTPIILDHAGCTLEHGLPQMDREFSLFAPKKKKRNASPPCKTCPACYAICAAGALRCTAPMLDGTECGHVFFVDEKPLDEVDGELVEVTGELWDRMMLVWKALLVTADTEERPPGWERKEFRKQWGRFPPIAFPKRKEVWSAADKLNEYKRLKDLEARKGYRLGWAIDLYQKRFNEPPPKLPAPPKMAEIAKVLAPAEVEPLPSIETVSEESVPWAI